MANKSKSDVIRALKICSLGDKKKKEQSCKNCPYQNYAYNKQEYKGTNCDEELMKDALEYLSGNITPEMNMHNCQLCNKEWLGRCLGKHYGKDVSVNNKPCDCYEFGGSKERLKEIEKGSCCYD